MNENDFNGAVAARLWIGDVSAERVGKVWRAEDHEALLSTMRAADELTLALIALAKRDALDSISKSDKKEEHHGIGSETQPVGADVHTGGK